ncbi:MAG: hypothetical protein M3Z27_02980 [Actinomycetota bacterium]|nr:hypothetical protein [Actinomycetota bacterium]
MALAAAWAGRVRNRSVVLAAVVLVLGLVPVAGARQAGASGSVLTGYSAGVRASGRVIVSFHADPARCAATSECDVQSGTLTWTPPTSGGLSIFDLGRSRRSRLQAVLELAASDPGSAQFSASTVVSRRSAAGSSSCTDHAGRGEFAFVPVREVGASALAFGLFSARSTYQLPFVPETPLELFYRLPFAGPLSDEPAPTACGGPLPADFLPLLPVRVIPLQALRRAPATVDLSGTAPFAAGGLAGVVRSTLALHLRRLKTGRVRTGAARLPLAELNRVITVGYRVLRVSGSVAVDVTGGAGCGTSTLCGLSGTLQLHPGPAAGHGYLLAYGSASDTSAVGLRRAVGLEAGRVPPYAQVFGLPSWTRGGGSLTADLRRGGAELCRDRVPARAGYVALSVRGQRVTASFGSPDFTELQGQRDLLRTRCPDPIVASQASNLSLASASVPLRALRRRILTLHLTRGAGLISSVLRWRSHPDLTIVLERTGISERLVPSSDFQS